MERAYLPPARSWQPLVELALEEDIGPGDATTPVVVEIGRRGEALIEARQQLVVCGLDVAAAVFHALDPTLRYQARLPEGSVSRAGEVLAELDGDLRAILAGERTALNFLGRMCGVASWTRRFVDAVAGTGVRIVDTRKTLPGWRVLDKYATAVGGAVNHRVGLFDGILLKDNHVALAGGIVPAVQGARRNVGHLVKIEVEVDTLEQLDDALELGVDVVLLDNMDLETLREAVRRARGRAVTEASGGIRPETVREVGETGVDLISLGWLTHSAPSLDVGFDVPAFR